MIPAIKIKDYRQKDKKTIINIFITEYSKYPYNEKWTKENAVKLINKYTKFSRILIAKINNKIVGFIIFEVFQEDKGEVGFISEIVVSKRFQCLGIGKKLMNATEKYLIKKNIKKIKLIANKKAKAIGFYKKINYIKTDWVVYEKEIK
ncbi:MAG: GNAT family N-acetyltransferase [Nanoarchaeota archaeon]